MYAYARNIEDRTKIFRLTKTLFNSLTDDISAGDVECVLAENQKQAKQAFADRDLADLKTVARFFKGYAPKSAAEPVAKSHAPAPQPMSEAELAAKRAETEAWVKRYDERMAEFAAERKTPAYKAKMRKQNAAAKRVKNLKLSGRRRHFFHANPGKILWGWDTEAGEMFEIESREELDDLHRQLLSGEVLILFASSPEEANYRFDHYEDWNATIIEAREFLDDDY